jgi:hypothetical protein
LVPCSSRAFNIFKSAKKRCDGLENFNMTNKTNKLHSFINRFAHTQYILHNIVCSVQLVIIYNNER